jgi:hypothetical protein
MTLDDLLNAALGKVSDKELLEGHLRLHQWFMNAPKEDVNARQDLLRAHQKVYLEFIRRGLHHSPGEGIDRIDLAYPKIESSMYSDYSNAEAILGQSIPNTNVGWHASLHDIWIAVKMRMGLTKPEEQLINTHDIVTNKMGHHPIWDELDADWVSQFKSFSMMVDEDPEFISLEKVLQGFPDKITLVSGAVTFKKGSIYIVKGIMGSLRVAILVKLLRRTTGSELPDLPEDPDSVFDLDLVNHRVVDSLILSYTDSAFPPLYWISRPFVYLVGGVVESRISLVDADILIRSGLPDWFYQHVVSTLTLEHPEGHNLHFSADIGLGPLSHNIPLYDLVLELAV